MQRFKERLVARRNALCLSQVDLANKSGVSARSIAGYETSGSPPTGRQLEKLASALGVSPSWLLGGEADSQFLREKSNDGDAEVWRRRAKAAEQELADLRRALRELSKTPAEAGRLFISFNANPVRDDSEVSSKPLSDAQQILKNEGDKFDREHPPGGS